MARGADPEDRELFAEPWVATLRTAVAELSWLLGRGYADVSALELVGNRHRLRKRQREAVRRASAADAAVSARLARRVESADLRGKGVAIDGFNCLITLEAALSGAPLFRGRDGVLRDIASVHGSWRRVETTETALAGIADALQQLGVARARWLLDRPVSNSGRLAALVEARHGGAPATEVELLYDPDAALRASTDVVASADATVLDGCAAWCELVEVVIRTAVPHVWIVDLRDAA